MKRSRAERFDRIERAAGRVFLSLLAVLFTLVVLELAYRQLRKPRNTEDAFHLVSEPRHVQKPYVMFAAKPGDRTAGAPFNKLGYLGALPSEKKPPGEFRVFVLGGSAVFEGSPPFSFLLERRLEERGLGNVKVFNFGVVSSVSRQELVRILVDIAGYEPDLILSYSGYNDLFDTGWDPRINYPHRYVLYEANPLITESARDFKWLPVLALGSQLARDFLVSDIFAGLSEGILPENYDRARLRPLIAASYVQNLRLSKGVSSMLGSRFLAFLQPTVYTKKKPVGREAAAINEHGIALLKDSRQLISAELKAHPGELEFRDLSELFANEERQVFFDYCHFASQWAYQRVVDYLVPIVEEAVRHRPAASTRKIRDLRVEEAFTPSPRTPHPAQ